MKKYYLLLFLHFIVYPALAQNAVTVRKTVQVLSPQTFYLNGGNMATFGGGKSRIWYDVKLPKNTVEWYYTFTTAKGQDPKPSINLFSQLTRMVDPTGFTAIAVNAIMTPPGTAVCDLYLMDRPNCDKFMEKVDNWGGSYTYWVDGSRLNLMQATVPVTDHLLGNLCMGFKNPSATQGITVQFEVVAVVEETVIMAKTENETKAEMFAELGWKAYEKGEYDKCMELSKKALELNPKLGWVNNNIGLVYLIKNDYISAIDSYGSAISFFKADQVNSKTWFTEALKDLNNLIAKHGMLQGTQDIKDILLMASQK